MRLFRIFQDAIVRAGGRLQIGAEVLRGAHADGRLSAVYTAAAAREQEHRANAFLLATGGVAGGGIRTDHTGAVWETALSSLLRAPSSRGEWFVSRVLAEGGHPIYRAGLATDERLRPIDGEGRHRLSECGGRRLCAGSAPTRCASAATAAWRWRRGGRLWTV